jgi:outer membrane protein assembly factor BamB
MYGHDVEHSFQQRAGCASIDATTVAALVPKWVVHTKDSVTASPTVVDGRVYVGSWDGTFYAVDAGTGTVDWTFAVDDDHSVAFGRIVASASVTRFRDRMGHSRKVVIFGGGASLYALDAVTGARLASIDLDPRTPQHKADDAAAHRVPTVEIESSPAVLGDNVFVGMDVHNQKGVGRTGLLRLRLAARPDGTWAFDPLWKFDPETKATYRGVAGLTAGSHAGFGCGGVWSSPAVDVHTGTVFFGTSNCDNAAAALAAGESYAEAMWAVRADTGGYRWHFMPAAEQSTSAAKLAEANLDDDFGASPNVVRLDGGRSLVGHGRKSAHYYARDPRTGAEAWRTLAGQPGHVSGGFAVGGFLGSTAVQRDDAGRALRIIGTTAVPVPEPGGPDVPGQVDRSTWAVRALDPATGKLLWSHRLGGPSYGAPTVANGVVFVPDTFSDTVQALDAASGLPLWMAPQVAPPASAPAVVGDSIYLGNGTRETDAEFKTARDSGLPTEQLASVAGPHPLSPLSAIVAFHLASGG